MGPDEEVWDKHVVATFLALHPDRGSEPGIGWNWLTQIASRVGRVTAVVPRGSLEQLSQDPRIPANVTLIAPDEIQRPRVRSVLPSHYARYLSFAEDSKVLLEHLSADLAHQVTLGTPYWGSTLSTFDGPRVLGPVSVSASVPLWALSQLRGDALGQELLRRGLLHLPVPLVKAEESMRSASLVLVGDSRAESAARRLGKRVVPMIQDGANPIPHNEVVPQDGREHLMWAGRFMGRKAPHIAVRAFAKALPRLPGEVDLVMFGDGPLQTQVAALVRDTGLAHRVQLRGHADRAVVKNSLGNAKALLFTSLRESFGGVVIEAAERGTPVIVAEHAGITGLTDYLPADAAWATPAAGVTAMINSLADGIVACATSTPEAWSARSRGAYKFAKSHDWNRRGQLMVDLYRRLA